jgi:hypothetical protein
VRQELEQLGWQVSENAWEESLELRLDAALLQRWFGAGATYRRQLEEELNPQRASDLEGLFRGQLGIVLPQPMGHRLLCSQLERPAPASAVQATPADSGSGSGRLRSLRGRDRSHRRSRSPTASVRQARK